MNWEDFKEMLTVEVVSITGGVTAGALLTLFTHKVALIPGLFILMPGFLALRGSTAATLASRIGTALHLHKKSASQQKSAFVKQNIHASFLLTLVGSIFLGLASYIGTRLAFHVNEPRILLVAIIAGFISNALLIPLTYGTTVWLFKNNYDPDNIMGPYITTVGDIISVISLLLAVLLV